MDAASESLIFTYYGEIVGILYRQWVQDGKQIPVDEALEFVTKLVCSGMQSVVKE